MTTIVCKNYDEMSLRSAEFIATQLVWKPNSVLGLPTGSTPIGTYKALINMYNEGKVDFSKAVTFNLDEYYPIKKCDEHSYDTFMKVNLFNHINLPSDMIHIPNGEATDPEKECAEYDECIASFGGIDLQLLGIGRNGHIGFNEPSADGLVAATHVTKLTANTIKANARFFESEADVPTRALTMGMASILKAKKIIMLVSGREKAEALKALLSDKLTIESPATMLMLHNDVVVICDEDCYAEATK